MTKTKLKLKNNRKAKKTKKIYQNENHTGCQLGSAIPTGGVHSASQTPELNLGSRLPKKGKGHKGKRDGEEKVRREGWYKTEFDIGTSFFPTCNPACSQENMCK